MGAAFAEAGVGMHRQLDLPSAKAVPAFISTWSSFLALGSASTMGVLLSLSAPKPLAPTRQLQLQARLSPEVRLVAVPIRPLTPFNRTTGTVERSVRIRIDNDNNNDELQELAQLFRAIVSGDRRPERKIQLQ
ncbi:hypothetical protein PR003_g7618 [Phytophthora rubi]|uniref:Uncharacterized protein n=1 Tax=Phytophthora rubi TaxID=129364 RepID=A0A6A4FLD5_9STRA|nr:hypothetical protein PR002_g7442 [Phytophthora rubi]KAE9040642.1 hypothetical protein PR001_g6970 [Phytophthora rubi]KAE9346069.1 hypothetical protein PR003_g7618 [Phytophthora rubi]